MLYLFDIYLLSTDNNSWLMIIFDRDNTVHSESRDNLFCFLLLFIFIDFNYSFGQAGNFSDGIRVGKRLKE